MGSTIRAHIPEQPQNAWCMAHSVEKLNWLCFCALLYALCWKPRSHRQLDNKFRPAGSVVLDIYRSVVVCDNRIDNRQPQSHSRFFG